MGGEESWVEVNHNKSEMNIVIVIYFCYAQVVRVTGPLRGV